jgi:aminoglycoside phosphotransferase (APT) family kinase protein
VINAEARAWVEAETGARLVHATRLDGATSATVVALRLDLRGAWSEPVLRLFTNAAWLAEEPDLAKHEAAALRWLQGSELPVPELLAVDGTGERCGVPAILMSRVPGRVELRPNDLGAWLDQQADALARVHALPHRGFGWRYRSWNENDTPQVPTWTVHPQRWQRALELWRRGPPEEPDRFLHRDYHPLNTLWRGERLSGIVDWVNACVGPASADLSHCRGNLVQMAGPDAADRFLERYLERMPAFAYHPFWDLDALVGWLPEPGIYPPWATFGLAPTVEQVKGRCEALLKRALARL